MSTTVVYNPFTQNFDFVGTGGGGGGTVTTLDGNTGSASPVAGVINVVGRGDPVTDGVSDAHSLVTVGSGNTLQVNVTKAQFVTNYTQISVTDSPYTALSTDYYISVDCSGGPVTIYLPDILTEQRMFLIKDRSGKAFTNNITITTAGMLTNFDGSTSYVLDTDYEAVLLTFGGSAYEAF
jgi:hypothetical protein